MLSDCARFRRIYEMQPFDVCHAWTHHSDRPNTCTLLILVNQTLIDYKHMFGVHFERSVIPTRWIAIGLSIISDQGIWWPALKA